MSKFSPCIIAYLDILGYKELSAAWPEDKLIELAEIPHQLGLAQGNAFNFKAITFADTIIIYNNYELKKDFSKLSDSEKWDYQFEVFSSISMLIKIISREYLLKGILLRGAITFGNFYHDPDKNAYIGPGLVRAHELEKLAIYPRIIIDPDYEEILARGRNVIICRDYDGIYSVSFPLMLKDDLLIAKGLILEQLDLIKKSGKSTVYVKWFYIARKFNDMIDTLNNPFPLAYMPEKILMKEEYLKELEPADKIY